MAIDTRVDGPTFFKILWKGDIAPENVVTEIVSGSLLRVEESEQWIEAKWQKRIKDGFKPWPNDTKPTRFRLCNMREEGGRLIVSVDPCVSYKDFAGSNTPEFLKQFSEECNPHPLAVAAILMTSDKKVVLTVRKNVDHKSGGYHATLGGFMDTRKENDVVSALYREMKEELGVEKEELKDVRCVTAVYVPTTLHTDIVFSAKLTLTSRELEERAKDEEEENSGLFFIPATREDIGTFLTETTFAATEVGIANLLLVANRLHGVLDGDLAEILPALAWFEEAKTLFDDTLSVCCAHGLCQEREVLDIAHFQEMIKKSKS